MASTGSGGNGNSPFRCRWSTRAIFIAGNGFDLSLGLKSSYQDFMYERGEPGPDLQHEFGVLVDKGNTIAKRLLEVQGAFGWVDIEQQLAHASLAIRGFRNTERSEAFKQEFVDLKRELRTYLKLHCSLTSVPDCNATRFLKEVCRVYHKSEVVNFNYTQTPEKCGVTAKSHSIHGSVTDDNLVFGIADNAEFDTNHSFLLKGGMRLKAQTTHLDVSAKMHGADLVVIFGHSLGLSDHTLFEPYFSSPDTIHRIIVITHHDDEESILTQLHHLTGRKLTQFLQKNHLILADTNEQITIDADRIYDETTWGVKRPPGAVGAPSGRRGDLDALDVIQPV